MASIQEIVECYEDGTITKYEAVASIISHITSENVIEVVESLPIDFMGELVDRSASAFNADSLRRFSICSVALRDQLEIDNYHKSIEDELLRYKNGLIALKQYFDKEWSHE